MPLTFDVDQAEKNITDYYNIVKSITNYAQASITAVPDIPNPPDWFKPIQDDLDTSKTHSNNWLNDICPVVSGKFPTEIVNFGTTFQDISGKILKIQEGIENQGSGIPTSQQRQDVQGLFENLTNKVGDKKNDVNEIEKQIKGYFANVESDQDKLESDLGTVANKFVEGKVWITELKAIIGENFLNSQILGPCTSIVEVDMNITLKINNVGANPTLITLIFAKAILNNQVSNQSNAEQAIQALLDIWVTLGTKIQAVISDLKDANDSDYINILSEVDLKTARDQWKQLSKFASSLDNQSSQTA